MKKNKKSNDLYESQLVKKILNSVLPIIENKLTEPYGISSGTYDDLYDQEVKNKKNADWALKRKENSRNRFKYNGHYERNPLYDETKPWNKEDYVLDTDDNGNYIPKEFNEDNDIISFYTFKDDKGNDTNKLILRCGKNQQKAEKFVTFMLGVYHPLNIAILLCINVNAVYMVRIANKTLKNLNTSKDSADNDIKESIVNVLNNIKKRNSQSSAQEKGYHLVDRDNVETIRGILGGYGIEKNPSSFSNSIMEDSALKLRNWIYNATGERIGNSYTYFCSYGYPEEEHLKKEDKEKHPRIFREEDVHLTTIEINNESPLYVIGLAKQDNKAKSGSIARNIYFVLIGNTENKETIMFKFYDEKNGFKFLPCSQPKPPYDALFSYDATEQPLPGKFDNTYRLFYPDGQLTPSKSYRFFLNINNNIKRTPSDEDGIYTKKQIISFYSKITNFLRKSYGYETKVRIDQNVVSKWMERFEDMNNIEHDDNYRTKLEKTPEKAVKDREGAFIPDSESQI